MKYQDVLRVIPEIEPQEMQMLEAYLDQVSPANQQSFVLSYSGRRRSPLEMLLFTLLGLVVVAGIQRFVIGQIGMGLLYLFTGGLCLIGTIVDAINHKQLAFEYNQKVAREIALMVR